MKFSSLKLIEPLSKAIQDQGYSEATPIQAQAIPEILKGKDVMAGARTGTGKTAAFALPILHKILTESVKPQDQQASAKSPVALVLVPTRELAIQVEQQFTYYAKYTDLLVACAYGGVPIGPQIDKVKIGIDILVATPGRLLDLCYKKAVHLNQLDFLVFDEADRMLDMGFTDEINAILKRVPATRQTLLFSATFDDSLFRFSKRSLNKPSLIEVDDRNTAATKVEQIIYTVDPERKNDVIAYLVKNRGWHPVLVFSRTKQGADQISSALNSKGIACDAIHADRSQRSREESLQAFKEDKIQVLVATDVAARGLDIDQLGYVINYEFPFKAEDYIHRIGRTGRAGSDGTAVTLHCEDENHLLHAVEVLLDQQLPQQWLQGFEPDLTREVKTSRRNSRGAQKRKARQRALKVSKKR